MSTNVSCSTIGPNATVRATLLDPDDLEDGSLFMKSICERSCIQANGVCTRQLDIRPSQKHSQFRDPQVDLVSLVSLMYG